MSQGEASGDARADSTVVVPISRRKLLVLGAASVAFAALGVVLLVLPAERLGKREAKARVAGALGVAFGLTAGAAVAVRARNPRPGLIVDGEGIVDQSSGLAAGRVPWTDVVAIDGTTMHSQRFVTIRVRDPERYASRGNALARAAKAANIRMTGTPIQISANTLAIDYDALKKLLDERYARWKSEHASSGS